MPFIHNLRAKYYNLEQNIEHNSLEKKNCHKEK